MITPNLWSGAFVSDVVIKQPSMATLTIGIADLLLLASGFAGLDRSSSLTIMEGALLLGRSLCFVLVWHKADRLRQDCVVT